MQSNTPAGVSEPPWEVCRVPREGWRIWCIEESLAIQFRLFPLLFAEWRSLARSRCVSSGLPTFREKERSTDTHLQTSVRTRWSDSCEWCEVCRRFWCLSVCLVSCVTKVKATQLHTDAQRFPANIDHVSFACATCLKLEWHERIACICCGSARCITWSRAIGRELRDVEGVRVKPRTFCARETRFLAHVEAKTLVTSQGNLASS